MKAGLEGARDLPKLPAAKTVPPMIIPLAKRVAASRTHRTAPALVHLLMTTADWEAALRGPDCGDDPEDPLSSLSGEWHIRLSITIFQEALGH